MKEEVCLQAYVLVVVQLLCGEELGFLASCIEVVQTIRGDVDIMTGVTRGLQEV